MKNCVILQFGIHACPTLCCPRRPEERACQRSLCTMRSDLPSDNHVS